MNWKVWSTAFACLLFQTLGLGLIFAVYGFYIRPVAAHFNQSTAIVNSGLAILLVASAVMSPLLGRLIDKSTLKPVILLGSALTVAGMLALSFADNFHQFVIAFVVLSIGVVMYGPLVSDLLLVRSYPQDRARAIAIASAGVSIAAIALPILVGQLIGDMSWQLSLRILAVMVFIGVSVSAVALVSEPVRKDEAQADGANAQGRTKIFGNSTFWILGLTTALVLSLMMMQTVILVPHFLSLGFDQSEAAVALAAMGVAGLVGKLGLAAASDRIRPVVKYLAIGLVILLAAFWGLLSVTTSYGMGIFVALALGLSNGLLLPLLPYACSVYFEETMLGQVNGLYMAMMLPFSLVGPGLAGNYYDINGDYAGVFVVFVWILVGLASLLCFLKRN